MKQQQWRLFILLVFLQGCSLCKLCGGYFAFKWCTWISHKQTIHKRWWLCTEQNVYRLDFLSLSGEEKKKQPDRKLVNTRAFVCTQYTLYPGYWFKQTVWSCAPVSRIHSSSSFSVGTDAVEIMWFIFVYIYHHTPRFVQQSPGHFKAEIQSRSMRIISTAASSVFGQEGTVTSANTLYCNFSREGKRYYSIVKQHKESSSMWLAWGLESSVGSAWYF